METRRVDRARVAILVGGMVLAAVLLLVAPLVAIDESGSTAEMIDSVIADRDRFFASNLMYAGFAALVGLSGLGFMLLARARASVLMTVGGTLMVVGGIALAAALTTYATAVYVTTDSALGRAESIQISNIADDSVVVGIPWILGGPLALLGALLAGVALILARTTRLWIPVLWLVGLVVLVIPAGLNGVWGFLAAIPFAVALVAVALSVYGAVRPPRARPGVPGQEPRHADESSRPRTEPRGGV
jgi:hypothetical protein